MINPAPSPWRKRFFGAGAALQPVFLDPALLGCWHTKNLFKNRHWLVTDPPTALLGNRYICLVHVNQACCLLSSASLSTFICSQGKITCSLLLQWKPCFPSWSIPFHAHKHNLYPTFNTCSRSLYKDRCPSEYEAYRTTLLNTANLIKFTVFKFLLTSPARLTHRSISRLSPRWDFPAFITSRPAA